MSGRKTVEISTYDYEKLREQAGRTASAERGAARLAESNRALQKMNDQQKRRMRENEAALNRRIEAVERRSTRQAQQLRQQLDADLAAVRQQISRQAALTDRKMTEIRSAMDVKLRQTNARIADLTQIVETNRKEAQREIGELRNETNRKLSDITHRLDTADNDARALLECAETYQEYADALIGNSAAYRCELLLPDAWKKLLAAQRGAKEEIALARRNPANSAVARSAAHALHDEALRFYNDIVAAQQDWQMRYECAAHSLALAGAKLQDSEVIHLDGENADVNVPFWGNHEINAIAETLSQAEETLDESGDSLTAADLDGIAALGGAVSGQIDGAVARAVGAAYGSQARIDKAAALEKLLASRFGLRVAENSYRGGDYRCAYRFRARNPVTGFEVMVTLSPCVREDGGMGMECECETLRYADNDCENSRRLSHEVGTAVMQALTGGDMSAVQTDHTYDTRPSDRRHRNEAEWRTEKVTQQDLPQFRRNLREGQKGKSPTVN